MDLLYGRRGSYGTYRVLEIVARIPYQTWETATYKQVSRHPGRAGRLWQRVLEYAESVRDHPELEEQPWASETCAGYGDHATVAQLLRQVSHDERCHKRESEQHLSR